MCVCVTEVSLGCHYSCTIHLLRQDLLLDTRVCLDGRQAPGCLCLHHRALRPQEHALMPSFLTLVLGMKLRTSGSQGQPLATKQPYALLKIILAHAFTFNSCSVLCGAFYYCALSLMSHHKPLILVAIGHEYTCISHTEDKLSLANIRGLTVVQCQRWEVNQGCAAPRAIR